VLTQLGPFIQGQRVLAIDRHGSVIVHAQLWQFPEDEYVVAFIHFALVFVHCGASVNQLVANCVVSAHWDLLEVSTATT
jgi:hypothetical protein